MSRDDPISKLTDWITKGKEQTEEKTRVMSKEQLEFYYGYTSLGFEETFGLKMYEKLAQLDQTLMMAYKGGRSDDVVHALTCATEAEETDTGIQPLSEHFKRKKQKREGGEE